MSDQSAFFFDAPLTEMPASQIPPKPVIPASIPTECEAFVQAALVVLETIPDGFDVHDVLERIGVPKLARVGWHWSRVLDAIKRPTGNPYGSSPYGEYQRYVDGKDVRYRRLPPLAPCRGFEYKECSTITRGGVLCAACLELEADFFRDAYTVFSSDVSLVIGSLIPTDSRWRITGVAASHDIPDSADNPSARYWYRAVPTDREV